MSMIGLLALCAPLIGLLMVGAGGAVYWNDPENKVIAAVIAGLGLLVFICALVGVAALFFAVPVSVAP